VLELLATALRVQCDKNPRQRSECYIIKGAVTFYQQFDGWSCG
jgi:hypothetical protein